MPFNVETRQGDSPSANASVPFLATTWENPTKRSSSLICTAQILMICWWFWVNYNDLTTTSLEIMVSKGNHPQMALIQVSELLQFTQMIWLIFSMENPLLAEGRDSGLKIPYVGGVRSANPRSKISCLIMIWTWWESHQEKHISGYPMVTHVRLLPTGWPKSKAVWDTIIAFMSRLQAVQVVFKPGQRPTAKNAETPRGVEHGQEMLKDVAIW